MADSKDIFGYDNKVQSEGKVLTSPMVMVGIDSNYIALVQQASVNYARNMTPVFEVGSDMLLFNSSGAQGTVNLTRAVGKSAMGESGPLLSPFATDDPCAYRTVTIDKSGNGTCGADPGTVTATGMLASVGITLAAGGVLVTDTATYNITSLSIG